jgi:hypothetical protein
LTPVLDGKGAEKALAPASIAAAAAILHPILHFSDGSEKHNVWLFLTVTGAESNDWSQKIME